MQQQIVDLSIFNDRRYIVLKRLLTYFGMWPALSCKIRFVCFVVYCLLTLSLSISLFAGIVYYAQQPDWIKVSDNVRLVLFIMLILVSYTSCYVHEHKVLLLFYRIAEDGKNLQNKDELRILNKYTEFSRHFTIYSLCMAACVVSMNLCLVYMPELMDLWFPLQNRTRESVQLAYPYYFGIIDLEENFALLNILHIQLVAGCNMVIGINIAGFMTLVTLHINGLFNILRLTHIFWEMCSIPVFSSVILFICGGAICGANVLDFLNFSLQKVGLYFNVGLGIFFLWLTNSIAQQIINNHELVFQGLCRSYWYNLLPKDRKLVHFFMLRSSETVKLKACGLLEINIKTFAWLMKTSISYAVSMKSFQNA